MRKKINVKDYVDVVDYVSAVNRMADAYFDDFNEYIPHFGRMEAVFTFFSIFIDEESLLSHFEGQEIDEEFLLTNEECLEIFNHALSSNFGYKLDFANAYMDAMEIVNTRKNSFNNAVEVVKKLLARVLDTVNPMLTNENIEAISKIAQEFSNGNVNADSIIESFMNKKAETIPFEKE